MLFASECHADWRVVPSIGLTERYTDNFWLESDELKQSQFITEIDPALTVNGKGRRYLFTGQAHWRHFNYRNEDLRKTLDHSFEYNFAGKGTLVDNLLFVDASGSDTPQDISAFGPRVSDAPYSLVNRAEVKTWRISPYLEHRIGQQAALSVRYSRDGVDSGDVIGFGKSIADNVVASLSSGPAFNTLSWGVSYLRQDLDDEYNGTSSTRAANANLRYALTRRFGLTASVGHDRYDFQAVGGRSAGRNWSAGFDWVPSQRTRVSAALGRHYYGQTGKFDLSHRSRRTAWSVNYDDAITTTRSQFVLPSTIDTASLLDSMFSSSISDPVLRQQAVQNYIRNAGLPPSLADSINYLSNRYIRQKQLQASVGFNSARVTGTVSVFGNERIALSTQESDSDLLGSLSSNLNDNVRQHGMNAVAQYRFNSRLSAVAAASWSHSRSLSAGLEDTRRDFRIGLTRELGRNVRAALDVRHNTGTLGFNSAPYRENAISATLSAQL